MILLGVCWMVWWPSPYFKVTGVSDKLQFKKEMLAWCSLNIVQFKLECTLQKSWPKCFVWLVCVYRRKFKKIAPPPPFFSSFFCTWIWVIWAYYCSSCFSLLYVTVPSVRQHNWFYWGEGVFKQRIWKRLTALLKDKKEEEEAFHLASQQHCCVSF